MSWSATANFNENQYIGKDNDERMQANELDH